MLEDDVHPPPVGEPPHLLGDVLSVVVDALVRTQLSRPCQLLFRASGDDDPRPLRACHLNRRLSDAAAGRKDEHRLTRSQLGPGHQHVPGGQEGQRERGGLHESDPVRNRDDVFSRHRDELGVPTF